MFNYVESEKKSLNRYDCKWACIANKLQSSTNNIPRVKSLMPLPNVHIFLSTHRLKGTRKAQINPTPPYIYFFLSLLFFEANFVAVVAQAVKVREYWSTVV